MKTLSEIAKEIGVGETTVHTAAQIKNTGRTDEVLTGEKTADQVIKEETIKSLSEQINPALYRLFSPDFPTGYKESQTLEELFAESGGGAIQPAMFQTPARRRQPERFQYRK